MENAAKPVKKPRKPRPSTGRPIGCPSSYTEEIGDRICEIIASGKSAVAAVKEVGISQPTLYKWLNQNPDFVKKYVRAREDQADLYADEIVSIADELKIDAKYQGEDVVLEVSANAVARNRLRVDARKWYASKLAPKKYGDKLESVVTGPDGGPVQHAVAIKFV